MKKLLFIVIFFTFYTTFPVFASSGDYQSGKEKSTLCIACHGADGNSTSPDFPKLAGQKESYLYHSLKEYKSAQRKNAIMQGIVNALSEKDMLNLATYFSLQKGLYVKY